MARKQDASFSIRLESDLLDRIERAAATVDRSRNWVITAILDKFFYEGGASEDLVMYIVSKNRAAGG